MSIGGGGGGKSGPTEQERGLAERGAMDFNLAMETVLPATSKLKQRITETAAKRERAGSEASLAAATATDAGSEGRVSESTAGRDVARAGTLADAADSSVGKGVATAEQGLDNQETTEGLRLAKAGRGIATEGSRMLADVARSKTNEELAKAKAELTRENAILGTAGTIAGAAAGAYEPTPTAPRRVTGMRAPDDGFRGV